MSAAARRYAITGVRSVADSLVESRRPGSLRVRPFPAYLSPHAFP